jgi:protein TonB
MPVYSLREVGTAYRDFPAAAAVIGERAGRPALVAVFPARASRPSAMAIAPDRNDRVPRSTGEVSRPRWPAWTAAVALHLAIVATILYAAQSLLDPAKSDNFEIALVFEPPASPIADAAADDRSEVVPTPPSPAPAAPPEPSPPVAEAVETAPDPPPSIADTAEPPAVERPSAPDDRAPPPIPTAKPAQNHRLSGPKPALAVTRRGPAAPRPPEPPNGASGEAQSAAPPTAIAAIPPPTVRSTPVSSLSRNRKPDYPADARRRGLQGRALLRVEVAASGTAVDVQVVASSGYSILDQAALAAVREWRFDPATLDGKPVSGAVEIPVRFKLDD